MEVKTAILALFEIKQPDGVADLDDSAAQHAQAMTTMTTEGLGVPAASDPVEITTRRTHAMPAELSIADVDTTAAKVDPGPSIDDKVTSMLPGRERQTRSPFGADEVFGMDQCHLAAVGQAPEAASSRIAIALQPNPGDGLGCVAPLHGCTGRLGDEDCGQPTNRGGPSRGTEEPTKWIAKVF